MTVQAIGMRPLHQRPHGGQRIVVAMKDGTQLEARTTLVVSNQGEGIVIYHGRRAIDESKALGWWPAAGGKG